MNKNVEVQTPSAKSGFTLVEIMLVLALAGLLVVGMIAGTYSSIAAQRYNDSVRSFAEYLRKIYSEVISPETLGFGNSKDRAILGKILVFGSDPNSSKIYSATITGSTTTDGSTAGSFIAEFANAAPTLYCGDADHPSTVAGYAPLWEASLMNITSADDIKFFYNGGKSDNRETLNSTEKFSGTLVIARTPTSSAVHTVWLEQTYNNIASKCQATSDQFNKDIVCSAYEHDEADKNFNIICNQTDEYGYNTTDSIGFCIKGDNVRQMREVRIAADGRNTSAVTILNTDVTDTNKDKDGGGNRCVW